jgi:hypothetical protein
MSNPLWQDEFKRKTKYYELKRTNGIDSRKNAGLLFDQTAATPVEPGKLVVSTDARSSGQGRRLAPLPSCAPGADLLSRIIRSSQAMTF